MCYGEIDGRKKKGIKKGFIRLRQNTLRCMCAACATVMNGEVNRAVAQRAKAGWLRRNCALIPRPALAGLLGASYLHA